VDSRVFCLEGAPPDYGFTGTISVHDVDAELCPVDPPLESRSWLPTTGDNEFVWNVPVSDQFAVVATLADELGHGNWTVLVTDHPAEAGTAPTACGFCFPTTRVSRSFGWDTSANPLCPGWKFFDGVCDAELVLDVGLDYAVGVSARTWGRIKALYR
jgi:hypothetical protein